MAWSSRRSSVAGLAVAGCLALAGCADATFELEPAPATPAGPRLQLTVDGAPAPSLRVPARRTALRSLVGPQVPSPWYRVVVHSGDGSRTLRINPAKYRGHVIAVSARSGAALVEVVRARGHGTLAGRAAFAVANAGRIDILTRPPAKPTAPALQLVWADKPRALAAAALARLPRVRWRQRSPNAQTDSWLLRDVLGAAGDRGAIVRVTLTLRGGGQHTITADALRRDTVILRRTPRALQIKVAGADGKTVWRGKDVTRIAVAVR